MRKIARKRKISRKALIIAIVICLITMIFIMLDSLKNIQTNNEPTNKAELATKEEKTEDEIFNQYNIKENNKKYNDEGTIEIEISFSKDLFENDISNREYFEKVIEDLVKIYKQDFVLIDNKRNIKIEVEATSENNYDYTINSVEDYYEKAEQINDEIIKKYEEIKEVDSKVKNEELKKFNLNNWSVKSAGVAIKEYGDGYLGYDGYKIITDDIYIDTIILENTYTEEIIDGIKVGTAKEDIIEKLGKPTFEEENVLGYKMLDSYIFFYDNEIAIYPNTNFNNNKIEKNILEFIKAEEKEERKVFAYKILKDNMDFRSYIDNENNLHLISINRGIEIIIDENLEVNLSIYNNYTLTALTKELIREGKIQTNFDIDLIFKNEKERK